MRMKKMLAVLAAISMLASMGISAAAEDETAVTTTVTTAEEAVTTAATEATTLTETEITTTAETTADSETETTVATEENAAAGEISEDGTIVYGTKTYQMGENGDGTPHYHEVKVVLYSNITEDWDETDRLSVYVDGTLSNLAGIAVNNGIHGDPESEEYACNPDNFFATFPPLDEIAITAYGVATYYYYDDISGQFVKKGEVVTTTTTTTSTTTTTTTVTSGETVTEEMLYQIFEEYVAKKQAQEEHAGNIDSYYYDAETQTAYGVYGRNGSMYYDRLCVITKDGVVEQDLGEMNYEEDAWDIKEAAYFTCNDSRFVVAVVDLYSNGGCLYAINVYNVSSGTPVKTNLYRILIGNVIEPHGYPVTDPNSSIELDDYFATWADDTITLNGVDYTYDTTNEKFVEVGNSGKTDDGKTDSGSTSNKPSTNNTTGTPKTGDVATLPAVALSLTMTAAGVAAIIYKKRK